MMQEKSEVVKFSNFRSMIRTESQMRVQVLKIDNVRDFFNSMLSPYLLSNGVVHQSTCVDIFLRCSYLCSSLLIFLNDFGGKAVFTASVCNLSRH